MAPNSLFFRSENQQLKQSLTYNHQNMMLLTSHIKEIMKNIIKKSEDHPKINSTDISELENFSSRFDLLNQNISVISADLHNVKNAHLVDYKILMKRINKLEDKSMNETSQTPVFKNGKKYKHIIYLAVFTKKIREIIRNII